MMNMKKITVTAFIILLILSLLSGCSQRTQSGESTTKTTVEQTTESAEARLESVINADHGSAVTPEGKTVLVSIFANDSSCKWDKTNEADEALKRQTLADLQVAADYLSVQVKRYGKDLSFIYNWEEHSDLVYEAAFDMLLVRSDGSGYTTQDKWLKENIDTVQLFDTYQADNIIFLFFFNTDAKNTVNPWSLGHANGDYILLEYSNFYLQYDGFTVKPATYAHEILHAFGAHDMYYANDYFPQKYVDYLKQTPCNDIMYTIADTQEITNDFTDLDAYFVGIAPRPAEADKWGLGMSEHGKF